MYLTILITDFSLCRADHAWPEREIGPSPPAVGAHTEMDVRDPFSFLSDPTHNDGSSLAIDDMDPARPDPDGPIPVWTYPRVPGPLHPEQWLIDES